MRLRRSSWPASRARRALRAAARPSQAARAASSLRARQASSVAAAQPYSRGAHSLHWAAHHSISYAFCIVLNSRSATARARDAARQRERVSLTPKRSSARGRRAPPLRAFALRRLALVGVQLQRLAPVRLREHARASARAPSRQRRTQPSACTPRLLDVSHRQLSGPLPQAQRLVGVGFQVQLVRHRGGCARRRTRACLLSRDDRTDDGARSGKAASPGQLCAGRGGLGANAKWALLVDLYRPRSSEHHPPGRPPRPLAPSKCVQLCIIALHE